MTTPEVGLIIQEVWRELWQAQAAFRPIHSPHEGIAVIHEEFLELQRCVYSETGRSSAARAEAVQLAAMAVRYVYDLCSTDAPGAP